MPTVHVLTVVHPTEPQSRMPGTLSYCILSTFGTFPFSSPPLHIIIIDIRHKNTLVTNVTCC